MNNDINQPQGNQPTGGVGFPPLPPIPEPTTPPPTPTPEPVVPEIPVVPTPPAEPLPEVATGLPALEPIAPPAPTPEGKPKEEGDAKPVKPKRKISKKLAIGGALVLLLLGGAIALAAQFGLFRGDIRQRAAGPCERAVGDTTETYCSNGIQYSHTCDGGPCANNSSRICGSWGPESQTGTC